MRDGRFMSRCPHQIPQRFQILVKVEKNVRIKFVRVLADRKKSFSLFQFLRTTDNQCELFKRRSTSSKHEGGSENLRQGVI